MIKKIKASLHEKLIFIFLIVLAIFALSFTIIVKNKCLFVKNFDPQKIDFEKPNKWTLPKGGVHKLLIFSREKYIDFFQKSSA